MVLICFITVHVTMCPSLFSRNHKTKNRFTQRSIKTHPALEAQADAANNCVVVLHVSDTSQVGLVELTAALTNSRCKIPQLSLSWEVMVKCFTVQLTSSCGWTWCCSSSAVGRSVSAPSCFWGTEAGFKSHTLQTNGIFTSIDNDMFGTTKKLWWFSQ